MNYTQAAATPATQLLQRASGTIEISRFDNLANNPVQILPPLSGYFYTIFAFALKVNVKANVPPTYPMMLRQTPFVATIKDSLLMIYPNDQDNNTTQGAPFGGFMNNTGQVVHDQQNTTLGYGVYLTSIIDEAWNAQDTGEYLIYYAVDTWTL